MVVLAGRPPCCYFLHSSVAELIFRTLVWIRDQDAQTNTIVRDHLLAFFQDERLGDRQRAAAILNIIHSQLRLRRDKNEELAIKSRFLADDEVFAFIERTFAGLPLNTIAACLSILHKRNEAAFARYYDLLHRQVETGLVLRQVWEQPVWQYGFFLRQVRTNYAELISSLRRQVNPDGLSSLISKTGLQNLLLLLSNLVEADDQWWQDALAARDDQTLDRMIDQTLAAGRSIGTFHLALQQLGQTDPDLLRTLEAKIGAQRYLRLITNAGTIYELFRIIEHSSPPMTADMLAALDDQTLDRLIDQTLAAGRSIGTLPFALRQLGQTNPDLLRTLEVKIGAQRYLRLVTNAGTIFELFRIIQYSSPTMMVDLIAALDDRTLDRLIDQTLAAGRSIGTLPFALRKLGRTDRDLLHTLEAKIGPQRWWHLILALGTMRILSDIVQRMSRQFCQEMAQAAPGLPPLEWQRFLLRGDFLEVCHFLRLRADFANMLFSSAFCKTFHSTFAVLISHADHNLLIQGMQVLRKAPDSAGKQYLIQLLKEHLTSLELSSLTFESLVEAATTIGLLWKYLPLQRPQLMRFLPTLLPAENSRWHEDEQFIGVARSLFRILAEPTAPPATARRLLHAGNSPTIAALFTQATTLDIFLYLWNLYTLWYQLHEQAGQRFVEFLDHTVREAVIKKVVYLFQINQQLQVDHREVDKLITLLGFLSFIGVAPNSIDRNYWQKTLLDEQVEERLSFKTFIPAVFFLLGLEGLYESRVRPDVWARIVPKALQYSDSTAALDSLLQLADTRAKR